MTLTNKQQAMRMRQPKRTGPRVLVSDPIAEGQLRVRLWYLWIKGTSDRELSKESDRPISWIRNWIDGGCRLV